MTELNDDFKKISSSFQQISFKYTENERVNKEMSSIICNLKQQIELLKENDKKSAEQIKLFRHMCNEQMKTISELHGTEMKNEMFIEENASLKTLVQNLNDKIFELDVKNNEIIQNYVSQHKIELENKEQLFYKREVELLEKMEVLQASFDLQGFEKDRENNNFKDKCEEKLKEAANKENQLKQELFKLNKQLSSNTAVLQKKILELEQKLKTFEREKSLYNISKGNFISANNIFKNVPTNVSNDTPPKSSIIRNISQNIENNSSKKFQFRKSHNQSNERKLLSESFDPFEMNKQMNSNKQNSNKKFNSSIVDYEINEENSDNSNNSESKQDEVQIINSEEINNEVKIVETTKIVKKRKLFNPRNTDYLG